MTPEQEAVVGLVRLLERLAIPHMVTGSVASSYHGRPRLTHDADVVVDPTAAQLEELVSRLLAEGHYVDAARARDALRVSLASAEDTILSKLEWAKKAGRSEKQIDDAAGVLAVNPGIDRAYVECWAAELGVSDLWREISAETRD